MQIECRTIVDLLWRTAEEPLIGILNQRGTRSRVLWIGKASKNSSL